MLCSICKEREATVHLTQITGDKMQKQNLCLECFAASSTAIKPNAIPLEDLLSMLKAVDQKRMTETEFVAAMQARQTSE